MKPRKLTATEVTFSVDLEPEHLEYEGHFSDKRDVAFIRKRLAAEQQEAWCCMVVTAKWHGLKGRANLGGVSLDCGQHPSGDKVARHAEKYAREEGLYDEALDALNAEVQATLTMLEPLLPKLETPCPGCGRHHDPFADC